MPKQRIQYTCDECGAEFPQWYGKCPSCNIYGTLVEQVVNSGSHAGTRPSLNPDMSWMRTGPRPQPSSSGQPRSAFRLSQIADQMVTRWPSGYSELDRVLGGGIVPGSLVLIGGEPGIGKSTLLLQVANRLSRSRYKILYVSAEESGQQVKLRAQRLGIQPEDPPELDPDDRLELPPSSSSNELEQMVSSERDEREESVATGSEVAQNPDDSILDMASEFPPSDEGEGRRGEGNGHSNFYLLPETDLEEILRELESLKPNLAIIDSIQTIYFPSLTSAPGSVAQVRECTSALMQVAKRENITLLIVGHVTKEGGIAGPRVLEHLVDTVLFFEGDRFASHRLLRSMKNRFGATHEIGVFEMVAQGLEEVTNPSELFLGNREEFVSGSSTIVACEGTRPIVVELQALVSPASFGSPRRATTGVDSNRLVQILAVLEKRVGVPLSKLDTYVSSVGGLSVSEPAADLGVAIAVVASFRDRVVDPHTILLGEVGLGGQVRPISQLELRLREAAKLGFKRAIIPKGQIPPDLGMEIIPVAKVLDAIIEAIPAPLNPSELTSLAPATDELSPIVETPLDDSFEDDFEDDFNDELDDDDPVF
ncbi:DNA repair protein RadA [Oxynema sp. CENA135]|uniref:DNA repair protein RadA n=1 Tax=Oxynema sp. CENA135 TaxID=984206 RepID=UPI00190E10F2|nr:DNA repair protein RadA [Oxynema sp. CENA135]MBK4728388.1 DNA repair protein RadA [Oxynema sp. CENA135]